MRESLISYPVYPGIDVRFGDSTTYSFSTVPASLIAAMNRNNKRVDGNDDVGDGSRERQNNTSKQQQPSHQRGVKRSKTTEVSPPENGKTLGDYFNERWFKSGLTDEQKEDFLLELKIKTLNRNSGFRQEAQKSLKIDL